MTDNRFSPVRKRTLVPAMLLLLLTFSACSQAPPPTINHIPTEANLVISVNTKQLAGKAVDVKDLIGNFFKRFNADSKDTLSEKILNSGIEFLSTAYFFGEVGTTQESSLFGVVIQLNDSKKFANFLASLPEGPKDVQQGEGFSYSHKGEAIIGWNNAVALFLTKDQLSAADGTAKLKALFNQKEADALPMKQKSFFDAMKENADVGLWFNVEKFGDLAALTNPGLKAGDFKNAFVTGALNFEKGQAVYVGKTAYETSRYAGLVKKTISPELIAAMPGKPLIGYIGMAFNMDEFIKYMRDLGAGFVNDEQTKEQTGLSIDEIAKIFTGDFAFTLTDVGEKPEQFKGAFGFGLRDKALLEKLLDKPLKEGVLKKQGNYYSGEDKVFMVEKNNAMYVVQSAEERDAILNGKTEKIDGTLSSTLLASPVTFYVDFGLLKTRLPDTEDFLTIKGEKFPLEILTVTTTSYTDKSSEGRMVLTFKNKEQNSFMTLVKLAQEAAESQ